MDLRSLRSQDQIIEEFSEEVAELRGENKALREALGCAPTAYSMKGTEGVEYSDWYHGPRKDALKEG